MTNVHNQDYLRLLMIASFFLSRVLTTSLYIYLTTRELSEVARTGKNFLKYFISFSPSLSTRTPLAPLAMRLRAPPIHIIDIICD